MIWIGIDCGLSGAIGVHSSSEPPTIYKAPVDKITDKKSAYSRWYNVDKIVALFMELNDLDLVGNIVLEYQRPYGGQGIVSTFRLARGFGVYEGVLSSVFKGRTINVVDPKMWQNILGKKYLTQEERVCFNKKDPSPIYDRIDNLEYREWYIKKMGNKSTNLAKMKTAYLLYKAGGIEHVNWKDDNLVDAYMIALYSKLTSSYSFPK